MTYQQVRFDLPSEKGGSLTAYRASTGKRLWSVKTGIEKELKYKYRSRPVINDRVIYFEPFAFDLITGKKLSFSLDRSYNCGIVTSAREMMIFRSATLGYFDLTNAGKGIQNFGGIRPGCWINAIPAGGLVLMPDATARCNCSYLMRANNALKPL